MPPALLQGPSFIDFDLERPSPQHHHHQQQQQKEKTGAGGAQRSVFSMTASPARPGTTAPVLGGPGAHEEVPLSAAPGMGTLPAPLEGQGQQGG